MKLEATQAMMPLEWIAEGENCRPAIVDEPLKELCHSILASGMLQAVSAIDHGDHGELFCGFRRVAATRYGLGEKLDMPTLIPVMAYPPTITRQQVKILQLTENIQHQEMTDIQLFEAVVELGKLDMTLGDMARALGKSKPTVCRWQAPSNCPAEGKEAFLAGKLTLGQCYRISTADDPLAMLKKYLKQEPGGKPPRSAKVEIPLAVNTTESKANGTVIVSSLPGAKIDLTGAESLLKEALRSVREAMKEKWTLKNAQGVWRDAAAMG